MTHPHSFFDTDIATYEAIDLLIAMCTIPAYSRDEKQKADLIEQWILEKGFSPCRIHNNIVVKSLHWDHQKPTLLLNSHIDTVKPVATWQYPPHQPTIEEDKITALGSNDAGASLVALLQVFILLQSHPQPYNILFVASAEEEVSGKNGIESIVDQLPKIDLAIVGEPTQMNLAIAERGLVVLDGYVKGVAGHAARNEGVNAIYQALPILEAIKDYQFLDISPLLGSVKVSITQIEAGKQHNIVPDLCHFVVDVRSNERYKNEEIVEMLNQVADNTLTPRSTRLQPSALPTNHPLAQRASIMGRELFGSPTLSDQALMPWLSAKIGPGDSARSHTADEYILKSEINEAIALYLRLLDQLSISYTAD